MSKPKILFIQSDSNRHLGLFEDLKGCPNIDVITFPNHVNTARKVLTRVSPQLSFATAIERHIHKHYERIVIVDTALARMDGCILKKMSRLGSELFIVLLNSIEASSPSFQRAKKLLPHIPANHIYTFDRIEAERYGFHYLGLSYYSAHSIPCYPIEHDVYFAGGLKGGREREIVTICAHLENNGISTQFECINVSNTKPPQNVPSSLKVISGKWIPYSRVLEGVARSRFILELLQHGQHAQSIRYFEAVCYNKNLLTNNQSIFDLPYYDSDHMFYFSSLEEIDCARIACADAPKYNYKGDFSPLCLEVLNSDS